MAALPLKGNDFNKSEIEYHENFGHNLGIINVNYRIITLFNDSNVNLALRWENLENLR